MPRATQNPRFEITIGTGKGSFTHVCAAAVQDAAVERVIRSYDGRDPTVVKIKPLGIISKAPNR